MADSVFLHARHFAKDNAEPLVILHGMLGSSRNWEAVSRVLMAEFDVYALDLRNHGQSPHNNSMRYGELAADVEAFCSRMALHSCRVIGHSMGGKVAMRWAMDCPERITRLVIVDIAPRDYPAHNRAIISAMQTVPLDLLKTRKDAEVFLESYGVRDWALRQFLLTNLIRDALSGRFRWQVHLTALDQGMEWLARNSLKPEEQVRHPALFVKGVLSDFIREADAATIAHHFPKAVSQVVREAGHNVHIDQRDAFLAAVLPFLRTV